MKKKDERREEFDEICENLDAETLKLVAPLIDHLIFIEKQLAELIKLPFIVTKPGDKTKQRATPAAKQYKELQQTYINALKLINSVLGIEGETVESPLRAYMEKRIKETDE